MTQEQNRMTPADFAAIKKYYPKHGAHWDGWDHVLSSHHSAKAIYSIAYRMRLKMANVFTPDDDRLMRIYYPIHGQRWDGWNRILSHKHGYGSIRNHAARLGLTISMPKTWEPLDGSGVVTSNQAAHLIGVTPKTMTNLIREGNLKCIHRTSFNGGRPILYVMLDDARQAVQRMRDQMADWPAKWHYKPQLPVRRQPLQQCRLCGRRVAHLTNGLCDWCFKRESALHKRIIEHTKERK